MNLYPDPRLPPTEELLTAYVDGRLEGGDRRRLEEWLAGHPDLATEVAGQIRLGQVWDQTHPTEPAAETWSRVLAGIERGLAVRRRRRWVTAMLSFAATAAALLLFAARPSPKPADADDERFEVLTAEDVEINSMDEADRAVLVVGDPPVQGPIRFAGPGDVEITRVSQTADGTWPRMIDRPGTPAVRMIVLPVSDEKLTLP